MGKTAKDIMTKAISYIGTKENPMNSNNVVFNTDFYGKPVSGSQYPWCCAFVWDIFRMCNASKLFCNGEKTAYCPYVENWGKSNKLTVDKNKGQHGDIVLFDFSGKGVSGHIGFIEKKNVDGTYTCVEGNTSVSSNDNGGAVMRRTRNVAVIRCIIRPKYEKAKTTTKTSAVVKKPPIPNPTLRRGSKGTHVKYLQTCLTFLGYKDRNGDKLIIDGEWGSNTDFAFICFQGEYGLVEDCIYGPKSMTKLSQAIKSK